jgi:deoxyribodipyrimidine photolyase-like uncharacterized protein
MLLAEVHAECTYVRHHKQKIALVLSAMRHFARALAARGVRVEHARLEDAGNTGTLAGEVARAVRRHRPARVVCTHPGEWRVLGDMEGWEGLAGLPSRSGTATAASARSTGSAHGHGHPRPAIFADGGTAGSEPHAASGAYINRMSDYCRLCPYDPRETTGPEACPCNLLYWDFLARHEARLAGNSRMELPLENMRRLGPEKLAQVREQAAAFLEGLD